MPLIRLNTLINAPIERCFNLSRSIDLHMQSTSHTKEVAIEGITSGLIQLGEQVTWRARHFGIYQKHTSKITAFDFPCYFQDTMIKGTFRLMQHDHFYKEEGGVTYMTDDLIFESPLGILGKVANALVLKNYLNNFLQMRNQIIKDTAESESWKHFLPS